MNIRGEHLAKKLLPGQRPDYLGELARLIRGNLSADELKKELTNYHENDIADVLEILSKEERERLYAAMDAEALAEVLEHSENQAEYLEELSPARQVEVLSSMEPGKAVDYLRDLPEDKARDMLARLPEETRSDILLIWPYDEDEIGSVMTTNYIEISSTLSIREAMRELVRQAADNDNISTLYVVDKDGRFCGAIDLKDLIIARDGTPLDTVTTSSYPYLYAKEHIEDCLEKIKEYSEDTFPVLDGDDKLVGVITARDFLKVVDDELGEDYAKLAGLSSEEDLNETLLKSISKRLPWLFILLGLGLIVSGVVSLFEAVVAQVTIIMCFQSLILDMAGNVGTQSLAVTIRVLMDERLNGRQKFFLVVKESRVGFANGVILGGSSFFLIGLYLHIFKGISWHFGFAVSGCISAALILAMFLASIVGTTIPIFFKKVGVDPAVASGPLITTVNDLVAVVTYYSLSWLFLIRIFALA